MAVCALVMCAAMCVRSGSNGLQAGSGKGHHAQAGDVAGAGLARVQVQVVLRWCAWLGRRVQQDGRTSGTGWRGLVPVLGSCAGHYVTWLHVVKVAVE